MSELGLGGYSKIKQIFQEKPFFLENKRTTSKTALVNNDFSDALIGLFSGAYVKYYDSILFER